MAWKIKRRFKWGLLFFVTAWVIFAQSCMKFRIDDKSAGKEFEEKKNVEKIKCPKDKEGNCPYGNEVGTCFGFCMQKIVNEFKEERRSGKQ